ncbi:MAG: hypothetical protein Q8L14_23770 [Myxococcales bacterium]|nr:hypothetical protein [Myxococcales bacterium]
MRAHLVSVVALVLAACGGFDNTPLRLGVVRGVVSSPTIETVVLVEQLPALFTRPSADGRFELTGVPQGEVTLLVLASASNAERLTVNVRGGEVAEVGSVGQTPGARLEIEVRVPSFQSRSKTTVQVNGFTLQQRLDRDGDVTIALPSGCYPVIVSLPGLGVVEKQVCVEAPTRREVHFDLLVPDGSPGREGCSVTGCDLFTCRSDGSCG